MGNGWSSRENSKSGVKRVHYVAKQEENSNPGALSFIVKSDEDSPDAKSVMVYNPVLQAGRSKGSTKFCLFLVDVLFSQF